MDPTRFDALARRLAASVSRRRTIVALALAALPLSRRNPAAAGPGCKNLGKKCKRDGQCCSGVCKGKKGKAKCKAHDARGCGKNNNGCEGPPCTTSAGQEGNCFTTTGNAPYCGASGDCFVCKEDKDCRPFCGAKAACIRCNTCIETGGAGCVGVAGCIFPP